MHVSGSYRKSRSDQFNFLNFRKLVMLRTVPTFVCVQCITQGMAYCHACSKFDIDVIHNATRHTTKMKGKFSYFDQVNFNEPVLKP